MYVQKNTVCMFKKILLFNIVTTSLHKVVYMYDFIYMYVRMCVCMYVCMYVCR